MKQVLSASHNWTGIQDVWELQQPTRIMDVDKYLENINGK